jgi:hypothetical protein
VSQSWLHVFSCSTFRLAFSKFLLLLAVWFSGMLLSCSSFLMTNNLFYIFFFRNDWIDVSCCSFKSFSFTVWPLLRELYYYRSMYLNCGGTARSFNTVHTQTAIREGSEAGILETLKTHRERSRAMYCTPVVLLKYIM